MAPESRRSFNFLHENSLIQGPVERDILMNKEVM